MPRSVYLAAAFALCVSGLPFKTLFGRVRDGICSTKKPGNYTMIHVKLPPGFSWLYRREGFATIVRTDSVYRPFLTDRELATVLVAAGVADTTYSPEAVARQVSVILNERQQQFQADRSKWTRVTQPFRCVYWRATQVVTAKDTNYFNLPEPEICTLVAYIRANNHASILSLIMVFLLSPGLPTRHAA